jgi:16S rRNA (cytosine967-C5)-methyltransferase
VTPAGRAAAAIELLRDIAAAADPADTVITNYFRRRRYAGSGDRRAIRELVYGVLRELGMVKWRLAEAGADSADARAWLIAETAANTPGELESLFSGGQFGPASLSEAERALVERLSKQGRAADAPRWARLNCPEWLLERFDRAFEGTCDAELEALNRPAPVDLRVNLLRATRADAQAALQAEGYATAPTPLSPAGLRSEGWLPLANTRAFTEGLVEVQDEGSQMLALAVAARPGERIADVCAGAGGKTLALAAMMENSGEIVAADVSSSRLQRMTPRLRRAGVTIARAAPGDVHALADAMDPFDRVLVDVPCSGTGTWRRHPEARWQLSPDRLAAYVTEQAGLLRDGARMVRPGGWLIYATCSMLRQENEDQAAAFLENHPQFSHVPAGHYLSAEQVAQAGLDSDGDLRLSPARNGADGVFAAVFEKATDR